MSMYVNTASGESVEKNMEDKIGAGLGGVPLNISYNPIVSLCRGPYISPFKELRL